MITDNAPVFRTYKLIKPVNAKKQRIKKKSFPG